MYTLPFMRSVERAARPRAVFGNLNPGRGLGETAHLAGDPSGIKQIGVRRMADGGSIIGDIVSSDPIPGGDLGIMSGPSPMSLSQFGSYLPGGSNAGNVATGFQGWMQNPNAQGKNWLKGGMDILTGILGGYSTAKANGSMPTPIGGRHAHGGIIRMAGGGATPNPGTPEEAQSQQIMAEAVKALMGQSQDPQAAIMAFVQHFGQGALVQLQQKVAQATGQGGGQQQQQPQGQPQPQGGGSQNLMQGPGDGMTDSIPVPMSGGGKTLLSSGEYVVPADAVSQLGNGDTQAGSRKLDAGIASLRQMKYGHSHQPRKLKANENPIIR